jgi:hypothetical protein
VEAVEEEDDGKMKGESSSGDEEDQLLGGKKRGWRWEGGAAAAERWLMGIDRSGGGGAAAAGGGYTACFMTGRVPWNMAQQPGTWQRLFPQARYFLQQEISHGQWSHDLIVAGDDGLMIVPATSQYKIPHHPVTVPL